MVTDTPRRAGAFRRAAVLAVAAAMVLATTAVGVQDARAAANVRVAVDVPSTAEPGSEVLMATSMRNVGDETATGDFTITQSTSSGLSFLGLLPDGSIELSTGPAPPLDCQPNGQTMTCDVSLSLPPGAQLRYSAYTIVAPDASGTITYQAEVEGPGASSVPFGRLLAPGAPLPFGFAEGVVGVTQVDGSPSRQAASTPEKLTTDFRFNTYAASWGGVQAFSAQTEHPRDFVVRAPAGLLANAQAAARCPLTMLTGGGNVSECPQDSMIGTFETFLGNRWNITPLHNMVPRKGSPATFGFYLYGVPVLLEARLRDGDYGADIVSLSTTSTLPFSTAGATLWGVPASSRHDRLRGLCLASVGTVGATGESCPTTVADRAFMRLPTSCSGDPLEFEASMDSHENPGVFDTIGMQAPALEGCEDVPFDPSLSLSPSSGVAGGPTGLDVVLSLPQHTNPLGLAQADLRKATVTLPEGMTINPASAHGLAACTDAQLRKGLPGATQCPKASKIGSVSVKTPLLDHSVEGSVFVMSQKSSDPGSGEMFRIAIAVDSDDDGIHLKLPGSVKANPETGRLTTTFDNNPQLPFSEFRLRFKGGQRAPLINPPTCGSHHVEAELTGWNGALRMPPASLEVEEGCAAPGFDPAFEAGSVSPVAGAFSPFVARFTRPHGDRELRRIDVQMPDGVLADLSKVQLCTDEQVAAAAGRSGRAAIAQPACPAGSQIGTTTVGAGAGSDPFFPLLSGSQASGRVFLTEPYTATKHGPAGQEPAYGLAIEVPAVAGPYDLGNVIVRAALFVDPDTAQVSIVSDPLPLVVKGVRLFTQDVRVNIDRQDFTVNPTSCGETAVEADISDPAGNTVKRTSRFQVGDCGRLGLSPRLSMRLLGKKQMRSGGNPALRVKLTQPPGGANLSRVRAALPKNLILDPEAAVRKSLLCPYERGLEASCPESSRIGTATAVSRLLKEPLRGPVYFVQGKRRDPRTGNLIRTLPALLLKLRGEVALNVRAKSDVKGGRLVSTFPFVPDAPVSSFRMSLMGGKRKGVLSVAQTAERKLSLCERAQNAKLTYRAHNDKVANRTVRLKTPCAKQRAQGRLRLRKR